MRQPCETTVRDHAATSSLVGRRLRMMIRVWEVEEKMIGSFNTFVTHFRSMSATQTSLSRVPKVKKIRPARTRKP